MKPQTQELRRTTTEEQPWSTTIGRDEIEGLKPVLLVRNFTLILTKLIISNIFYTGFVALWFILRGDFFCLTLCHFVLVFFSPFSIALTSLGEERANLSAFCTFVRFVLVWICWFLLLLGVWEGLRFVIVAFPGLFSYLFLHLFVALYI